jgi:hypothetical protein
LDNGKVVEVIATNNFKHYLDNMEYNCPKISRRFAQNDDERGFGTIVNRLK